MKDSSQAPLDSHTVFDRIVSELDDAIEKLPLEKMIDSAKFAIGNRSSPIPTLVEVAEDRLDLLAVHARIGDEEAILALRDLGIRIAKELQYLGDIVTGGIETKDTSISPERKSIDLGGSSPVAVRLRGDLSEINEVLIRKSDDITSLSLDPGRNYIHQEEYSSRQAVIDVIDSLFWPDSFSDFIHHDFQSDSVYNGRPEARLERAVNIVSNEGGYISNILTEARPGMLSHIVIRKIIGKKIELKMAKHFRMKGIENTKAILSKSLTWPISTSAFKDSRDELEKKLELMALGSALPFRLTPKGKAGAKRKLKYGSYIAFALEYCIKLEEIRTQRQVDSASSSDDVNASDPISSNSHYSRGEGRNENEEPLAKHPFQTYADSWVKLARDLPPFPDSGRAPSEMEGPDLRAWHKAAMSRAEAICSGQWDDYPWWPECVKKRAGVKASRLRSPKEAVSEKLLAGMKRLQVSDGSV